MIKQFILGASQRRVVMNALGIALVVGTLLNLINEGDKLLSGRGISWWHILMNYLVPYCVATFSAVKNEADRQRGDNGKPQ